MKSKILSVWLFMLTLSGCQLSPSAPVSPSPTVIRATTQTRSSETPLSAPVSTTSLAKPSVTPSLTLTPTVERSGAIPYFQPGSPLIIQQVKMLDRQNGWAVAGDPTTDQHILSTRDGGHTWADVTPPEPVSAAGGPEKRVTAFFLDALHAWAVFSPPYQGLFEPPQVWATTDGGLTWSLGGALDASGLEDTFFEPRTLTFIDPQRGWLELGHDPGAGQHPVSIYRTQDGGATWQRARSPYDEGNGNIETCCQTGMIFADDQLGLVTGGFGPLTTPYIDWTHDGGATWETQDMIPPQPAMLDEDICGTLSPLFIPPDTFMLVMSCQNYLSDPVQAASFLYSTGDAGKSWSYLPLPDPPARTGWDYAQRSVALQFLDPPQGWVFIQDVYQNSDGLQEESRTHLYFTADSGVTWQDLGELPWQGQFSFVDPQFGLAVAHQGEAVTLMQTQDGGRIWTILQPDLAGR